MAKTSLQAAFRCRPWFWVAALVLLPGCHTTGTLPLPMQLGPGGRVQQGQAIWRPGRGRPELAGELLLASTAGGGSWVELTKTPLPLVVAIRADGRWRIEFPGAGRPFAGRGDPPARFLWLYLRPALAGEALPRNLKFARKPEAGWRLENVRTGETLEGFLAP